MGLMDRFKKKDDLGLDDDPFGSEPHSMGQPPGQELSQDPFAQQQSSPFDQPQFSQQGVPGNDPLGMTPDYNNPDLNSVKGIERPKSFEQYQQPEPVSHTSPSSGHVEKDLQIIIAKLDALKSEMDSLHQRVQKIERIADEDREASRKKQQQYRW